MTRLHLRLTVAALLTVAGLRWIINSNPWSGPVLLTLSPTHGVHLNDWLSFVLWGAAHWVLAPLWSPPGQRLVLPVRRGR